MFKSANINKGDIIYTSGVSDIYPHNIPVCEVIKAEINKNNYASIWKWQEFSFKENMLKTMNDLIEDQRFFSIL